MQNAHKTNTKKSIKNGPRQIAMIHDEKWKKKIMIAKAHMISICMPTDRERLTIRFIASGKLWNWYGGKLHWKNIIFENINFSAAYNNGNSEPLLLYIGIYMHIGRAYTIHSRTQSNSNAELSEINGYCKVPTRKTQFVLRQAKLYYFYFCCDLLSTLRSAFIVDTPEPYADTNNVWNYYFWLMRS